jgi:flagellar biosynthesis protein
MQVDLDAHIPPALYVAVAELLVWIWRVDAAHPAPAAAQGAAPAL